jgi:hypothetical protein
MSTQLQPHHIEAMGGYDHEPVAGLPGGPAEGRAHPLAGVARLA